MSGWVDGVHPLRCVEWRWCVLLPSCPVRWWGLCPTHPTAVLASTAVMSCTIPLPGVWRVDGVCVSVLFVWWGILCALPPRRGGGWGHRGWWCGMVSEGRLCCRPPRLVCGVPLLFVWWSRGMAGCGGLCVVPRSDRVLPFILFSFLLHRLSCSSSPSPPFVFSVTALLV